MTVEEAKELILRKAEEIRSTVDRSRFCKPDCEACLRSEAKGLVDLDLGITNSPGEILRGAAGHFSLETVTDEALFFLRC